MSIHAPIVPLIPACDDDAFGCRWVWGMRCRWLRSAVRDRVPGMRSSRLQKSPSHRGRPDVSHISYVLKCIQLMWGSMRGVRMCYIVMKLKNKFEHVALYSVARLKWIIQEPTLDFKPNSFFSNKIKRYSSRERTWLCFIVARKQRCPNCKDDFKDISQVRNHVARVHTTEVRVDGESTRVCCIFLCSLFSFIPMCDTFAVFFFLTCFVSFSCNVCVFVCTRVPSKP